jgi:MoaA/NifB/PqqE/SkfB family radical SAM enzyme
MRQIKTFLSQFWSITKYTPTFWFYLKNLKITCFFTLLFVKLFVKEGEGSLGVLTKTIEKILKPFGLSSLIAIYPRNIEMEITSRCNKQCLFCEHTYWNEPKWDLTYENMLHITAQFPRLRWVNLTGEGDSFLNRDYLKIIQHLKSRSVAVYLVDSFDLITRDVSKTLVEYGVDGIYISFDAATKETYEFIKKGCSFERTLTNIRNLIEIKKEQGSPVPELCFRFVVNTLNYHEMPNFLDLIRSLGKNEDIGDGFYLEFVGLLYYPQTAQYFLEAIPDDILQEVAKRAERYNFRIQYSHPGKEIPELNACSAWVEPYIMMGGYVLPCCQVLQTNNREWLRQHAFGNMNESPFPDIWFSERYKRFRKMIPNPHGQVPILCQGCRAYNTTKRIHEQGISQDI